MKLEENGVGAGARKVIIVVFVLALCLVSGVFFFKDSLSPDPAKNPDAHFKDCKILAENCVDVTKCGFNVYCGDGIFADCRVYDCDGNYGVYTKDVSGNINFKNEAKTDESAIKEVRDACDGTMQILSQDCVDNKMEMKLKLKTNGECEIENFATIYGDAGAQPNAFVALGNGVYSITANTCETISEIIPAARGGVGLNLSLVK